MSGHSNAYPIKAKFLTPTVWGLIILAATAVLIVLARLIFGIGSVTNLSNSTPWGLWIGVDVGAGVALAAGGFTTAAIAHIMNREEFHSIVRPALLTALLGYTFVASSVMIDIGRWYYIWHPLIMWNGNSALFEVGICVMIYLTVLYIEFLPIVTERFIGHVNLPGFLKMLNRPIDKFLRILDRGLNTTMSFFIIAGVVLSCLHQSSLGTLMIIAGPKMHPLWQTPILPLLFLLSAFSVGFPMVIMEAYISAKSFKLRHETEVISKLARFVGPLLGIYFAFKIGDMVIRETFVYLTEFTLASTMFVIELLFGIIIPLRMFLSRSVLKSPLALFIASSLVIFGVLFNRFNNFIIAYNPPFTDARYFPSIYEFLLTIGFIAFEVLLYRACVMIFPVVSKDDHQGRSTKYAIRWKV